MNSFFRILSYANKLRTRLAFFFGYSILGIIFGAFNIVLVMPMLDVLFKETRNVPTIPPIPEFTVSTDYVIGVFNHYFLQIVVNQGICLCTHRGLRYTRKPISLFRTSNGH
jgi:ATP-binding cassette, subfamily B, bacterial MsbA